MELKGGHIAATQAIEQLQGGADIVHHFIPGNVEVAFRAVLACNGVKPVEVDAVRRSPIQFRGREYRVRIVRCGSNLEAVG